MQTKIVLGLGYGDEGKGLVTAHHAGRCPQPLVIRFSGGHQAGHTVVTEHGERHVFSNLGSGTLAGAPTYWSRFCTFSPVDFWRERQALAAKGWNPTLYVDALAPVTTPYDVYANRTREQRAGHGSCGMGVGATYERMEGPHKLYVQDLLFPAVLRLRLAAVRAYYAATTGLPADWEELEALFIFAVEEVLPVLEVVQERRFFQEQRYETYIFEGSQGILLDMDHGFFPHVTRARTTSCQAWELIKANGLPDPEIYYVTRAYQTRHGNGPLSNETRPLTLRPTPLETNQYNPWQGHQRRSILDAELLNYALTCDANYGAALASHLVMTCLDQLVEPLRITAAGTLRELASGQELLAYLDTRFMGYWESWSDGSTGLQQVKGSHLTPRQLMAL